MLAEQFGDGPYEFDDYAAVVDFFYSRLALSRRQVQRRVNWLASEGVRITTTVDFGKDQDHVG